MNFYDTRGPYFSQGKGETRWRFLLQVVALILGRFLHYFTVFNQCFNERHFLMEISVNRIIIAGTNDQRRGEGGGDRIESHSSQLFRFLNHRL